MERPASVVQMTNTVHTDRDGLFRIWIPGAHALRLISQGSTKEGSTVSCVICDRWLILS